MAQLTRDSTFKPALTVHSHSYVDVEDDCNEIYAAAFVQRTATGRVVIVGDSGGLGVGPVIGVNESNVPDQAGKTYSGPLERPTAKVYVGLFERPFAASDPPTDADMFHPVYAANNQDVTNDSTKPLLGIMVGINNEAETCTVLIGAGAAAALRAAPQLLAQATIAFGDFTVAGLSEVIDIGVPVSEDAVALYPRFRLVTPFAHGTAASMTMKLGHDNDDDAFELGADVFTGSQYTGVKWAHDASGAGIGSPLYDGTATGQVQATFAINAGLLTDLTAGEIIVQLWGHILP